MRLALSITFALLTFISLSGCVATRTPVNTSLPYEVQQNIRTAADQEVAFEFVPAAGFDEMEVRFQTGARTSYPFNGPMRSLYQELIESKFARINPDSPNRIRVEMSDVQQEVNGMQYTVSATAHVTTVYNGETNERDFGYSQTMEAQDRGTEYTISNSLPQEHLQNFMIKFIVATDRFIDANFGIR